MSAHTDTLWLLIHVTVDAEIAGVYLREADARGDAAQLNDAFRSSFQVLPLRGVEIPYASGLYKKWEDRLRRERDITDDR